MVKAALQSPLDGYQSPYNLQQHVNFVSDDLHIYELRYDNEWHLNDLTHLAGAPAAAYPSGIAGYVTSYNNQQHINFYGWVGQHFHVHELVYDGGWHHNDLTQLAGAPSVVDLVGRPASYVTSCNNQQHVIFVGDNFHVYELYHDGGGWHHNDLTLLTSAPPAGERVKVEDGSWVSALAAYETTTCQNRQHVNFVGTDRHVHELVYDGAWHHNDLTHLAGAPPFLSSSVTLNSLDGYATSYNNHKHVNFLGNDLHVHELVYDGAWHHNDLTALT